MTPLSSAEVNTEQQGNTAQCFLWSLPPALAAIGLSATKLWVPWVEIGSVFFFFLLHIHWKSEYPRRDTISAHLPSPFLSARCLTSLSLNLYHQDQFLGFAGIVVVSQGQEK